MNRTFTTGALCSLSLAVSLALPASARSQEKVGVATTVFGPVTVTRASMAPAALKFKDDILLRDRVTTGDNAITRILLGGKVIVTARERSTLTITEVPGLSTIYLPSGRIAVAVDKTRMKSGERVEIRTQNAIAGVRGTVLVVEAEPNVSTVTVLRGLVDVTRLDPAAHVAVGPVTPVAKHQTVTVRNNVLPSRAQSISPARAEALSREFTPPVRQVAAAAVMPVEEEVERARMLLNALLPAEHQEPDRSVATASGSMNREAEDTPNPGGPVDPATLVGPGVDRVAPAASSASSVTGQVLAPVATTLAPVTTAAAPALAPVTTTLAPVTTAVAPVLAPVATTLAPVTTAVAPVLAPVTTTLAPAVAPITTSLAPVVAPITTTLAPALAPVTTTLAPAVAPITTPLAPALAPLLTTPTVPTAPLAPPPPTSSGSLLGGALKPVTDLLK